MVQLPSYLREYRSFKEARAFARKLGLKSETEWRDYCKSGKKPGDIPVNPNRAMPMRAGLVWGDWLGTGHDAAVLREYRSFKEARDFVRGLGLKSGS